MIPNFCRHCLARLNEMERGICSKASCRATEHNRLVSVTTKALDPAYGREDSTSGGFHFVAKGVGPLRAPEPTTSVLNHPGEPKRVTFTGLLLSNKTTARWPQEAPPRSCPDCDAPSSVDHTLTCPGNDFRRTTAWADPYGQPFAMLARELAGPLLNFLPWMAYEAGLRVAPSTPGSSGFRTYMGPHSVETAHLRRLDIGAEAPLSAWVNAGRAALKHFFVAMRATGASEVEIAPNPLTLHPSANGISWDLRLAFRRSDGSPCE